MNRFWELFIDPLVEIAAPRHIVEIGAFQGDNTRKILKYCEGRDCRLTSIDPAPAFDAVALKEIWGNQFTLCQDLSLKALPNINRYDMIFIDGDHNWYTVYHELKIVESHMLSGMANPIVVLHDIGWPYAYRDVYYDPDNVPESYRQPVAVKGMKPGQSELEEQGGINDHIYNAIREGGPRNGTMSAIQDFLRETSIPFVFRELVGHNGLGILFPEERLAQNESMRKYMEEITLSERMDAHVRQMDYMLNLAIFYQVNQGRELEALRSQAGADRISAD